MCHCIASIHPLALHSRDQFLVRFLFRSDSHIRSIYNAEPFLLVIVTHSCGLSRACKSAPSDGRNQRHVLRQDKSLFEREEERKFSPWSDWTGICLKFLVYRCCFDEGISLVEQTGVRLEIGTARQRRLRSKMDFLRKPHEKALN